MFLCPTGNLFLMCIGMHACLSVSCMQMLHFVAVCGRLRRFITFVQFGLWGYCVEFKVHKLHSAEMENLSLPILHLRIQEIFSTYFEQEIYFAMTKI